MRIALIIFIILFIFIAVVIAFISPIMKHLIEENSEEYIGRKVTMGWLYFNPFTGGMFAHDIIMFERQSSDTFIRASGVSCNVHVIELFKKTFNFSHITLDRPWMNIIQDSNHVNFADWLVKDSTKKATMRYCIRNIQINDGEIHYTETVLPVYYYIKKVNIYCPAIEWNIDTMLYKYDFESGTGSGKVKGVFNINVKSKDFDLRTLVSHLDLEPMEQYVKDFASYGDFSAFLDANIHTIGNTTDQMKMMTKGNFAITDFHFGKTAGDDYISFSKFSTNIDSLSPANKKYFFSEVALDSPYIKYEKYDSLDNFSRIVGPNGANIQEARAQHASFNIIFFIADYLKELALNIVNSDYHLNQLSITNAHLLFNDYSLLEKFSLTADPIKITARNMSTRDQRMSFAVQAKFHPFGDVDIKIDVDPKILGDFHLTYDFDNLPLPVFNPYMVTSTAHPFHKGTMELHGDWKIANKRINGENHVLIINPELADKVKNKGATSLPMGIVMWFMRRWNRTIDISIPITGDLKNPTYHFSDVIFEALKNLFVKPPIFPYTQTLVKERKKEENFILMEWKPMQSMMDNDQQDQLKKISRYMIRNPQAKLIISPTYFENLEKESILFYEAKKKFYASLHKLKPDSLTEDDSIAIMKMSIKDSVFTRYLDRAVNQSELEFTVQGKCRKFVGQSKVNKEYKELIDTRKKQIMDYLADKKVSDRVTFEHGESTIPPSGFSHYHFNYEGEQPEAVNKSK
ncbi:MAG TPA: DUF748 domain-containing protein [Chitinophagales bacterium]|nr:DUF748 domain-containing protein [Chitinophagales bacterium]